MPFKPPIPLVTTTGAVELTPDEIDAINTWIDVYKRSREGPGYARGNNCETIASILGRLLGHATGLMSPRVATGIAGRTYRVSDAHGQWSITCLKCGMTSYNINDVTHLYCGNCHLFHEEQ